ncbi:ester cyclase [Nocardia colli]|nr:ester cyclase [Nocardia colli]
MGDEALSPAEVISQLTARYNAGDLAGAMSYISEDAVNHGPPPTANLIEWRARWDAARAVLPDLQANVQLVITQDDLVCRLIRITGTSAAPESAGKPVDVLGMDIIRVRDGLVVEHWALADTAAMTAQLQGEPPQ